LRGTVAIRTANIDPNKRLYVATQQTMGVCYEQFSPGFFDLIVSDEHRSIRFTEVIEYFDARMVGLTATPAAFIDRDTFRVFDCRDQTPTFLYTYEQAISTRAKPKRFVGSCEQRFGRLKRLFN
jgi:type I restriction enzyme, R subunit